MENNLQEMELVNTRVRMAQKEALQRFYSSVQDEVIDAKKVAEEMKYQNDIFDKRVLDEKNDKLHKAKQTQENHLRVIREIKPVKPELKNIVYPDLFEQTKEEHEALKKVKQRQFKRDLDNQMRFKRYIQEAIGYLQKENTLNQPLLSSKDVPISPAT